MSDKLEPNARRRADGREWSEVLYVVSVVAWEKKKKKKKKRKK